MNNRPPAILPALVHEMVLKAHGDLARVQELLTQEAALANAAWDWGGGDWESALGSAAHMGRRDIAEALLAHGARLDIFAAAMLGELAIVQAILTAFPAMRNAAGPHGIPLIVHAQQGGAAAQAVMDFLEQKTGK